MKYWFDTEFLEDGKTIDLISIGIVAEDGREYYAETLNAKTLADSTDWLRANVLPHLKGGAAEKGRADLSYEIVRFMGQKPEIWAYYADYDWVALCQIYGRMIDLPKGWPMFCRDVKQLCVSLGDPKLPKQASAEHNALADARWTKEAWEYLQFRAAVKSNPDAVRVKIEDLRHNSDIRRLKGITEKDVARMARYHEFYLELVAHQAR